MSEPGAPDAARPPTSRPEDAAAMLLTLAADLPHPPRARPVGAAIDDELRPLADWFARTAGGTTSDELTGDGPTGEADRHVRRARLIDVCGVDGREAAAAVIAAAGLDLGDREPSLDPADPSGCVAAAQQAVDAEVDEGADLLVLIGDERDRECALGVVSLMCRLEPAALMPYGTARDDAQWMGQLSRIRDARRAAASAPASIAHGVCATGGAALIAATAALLQSARRRTPAIIDGLTPAVAAMAADALAPGASAWWRLAGDLPSAVASALADRLDLRPLCPFGADAPVGAAGALAVAMLRMAVAVAP